MRGNDKPYHVVSGYPLPLGFNGKLAWVYRWFSGRPLNGHRYTDATGFRHGTTSLDVSGHATTYQLLPGYLRFLYARLPLMAIGPAVIVGYVWPWVGVTLAILTVIVATLATWRWHKRRAYRRDVIEPVAAGVSAVIRVKRVKGLGHRTVTIPRDIRDNPDSKITVKLPVEFIGNDADKLALVKIIAAKLNVDELTPSWSLHGATPFLTLAMPPKPPELVTWLEAIGDADGMSELSLMLGYGPRKKIETFDLNLDSPHALINGGSGSGKSVLLAWLAAQLLRRGYGVIVLDAKFVSHTWLRRIPGVYYASEGQELHEGLCWLGEELLRRARFVSSAPDMEAAAATLTPIMAILEEINGAYGRLKTYWKSIKGPNDPALSPALTALQDLANMGRELRCHVFLAGQSITAKTTGGPEGRESFGARMLARATANAWRMLAPQIKPAPVKRDKPGRWRIVIGDTVREYQVPLIDLKSEGHARALIDWSTGGRPVPDVAAMVAEWVAGGGGGGGEYEYVPSSEPPTPAGISLRAYADEVGLELATLTRWRERRSDFPSWVAVGARNTHLYDRDHLRQYVATRLREPAAADAD